MTSHEFAEWRAFHGELPSARAVAPPPAVTAAEDRAARDLMKRFTKGA